MNKILIILLAFIINSILVIPGQCFLKGKTEKKTQKYPPSCTIVGELQCPKGLLPKCPKQYKPSCVFVGTMQLPACLANNADNTFFSYNLDTINCKKK